MDAIPVDTSRYIAFEGIEGAGKSTIAKHVAKRLEAEGHAVVRVREPGGTDVGEAVRSILLDGTHHPNPRSEAALFAAARAQLVHDVVLPALEQGAFVLSDRSAYSSLAYQAGGRGIALDEIRTLNDIAIDGVWPGIVVLLLAGGVNMGRSVAEIIFENLIIFAIVGAAEYIFFKLVSVKYIPIMPSELGKDAVSALKETFKK